MNGIFSIFHLRIWAVTHIELLTYNIYMSGRNVTCSTALWASVPSWMWLVSRWLEHGTCNAGRKTGMCFQLFMLEWGWLQQSTRWGNKEPPPACVRVEITPFPGFVLRPVPWLWLWHEANAWAYDVNKHFHCRYACLGQLSSFLVQVRKAVRHWPQGAQMTVGKQRKEVMPQFLWPQPSLYQHMKENCPGVISISLYLMRGQCWQFSYVWAIGSATRYQKPQEKN